MHRGIREAKTIGRPVEFRSLNGAGCAVDVITAESER
jgi:hypothetical protein